MNSIQIITDETLVNSIDHATNRVLLIAPGLWPSVAEAVAAAWHRLGSEQVTVILDIDPEICRIGYGSLEAIAILQKAATAHGEAIGQQPGVRICIYIVDDQTFVFSPTPRQLEAAPGDSMPQGGIQAKANGIILSSAPSAIESALGAGAEGIGARTLGMEALDQKKLESVAEDLLQNPVKKFDLAQAVSVYNAKIQFVEFSVTGCQLSEHTAQLPGELLHIVKNNPVLSRKISNSIKLIEETDPLVTDPTLSQNTIFARREKIQEEFLRPIRGIGTVIRRSQKKSFEDQIKSLKELVASFGGVLETKLAQSFKQTAEELAEELLEGVMADIPKKWKKQYGPQIDRDWARMLIVQELLHSFGTPHGKVARMKVETIFKDVTYDMLNDADFQNQIAEYFPDLPVMEEFKAAKERDDEDRLFP